MMALTPIGVARVLVRGTKANFSPEDWGDEVEKLVNYLEALSMAREDETDALAQRDSDFLKPKPSLICS